MLSEIFRHARICISLVVNQRHHCVSENVSRRVPKMIKDILVNLTVVGDHDAAGEFAVSVGSTLKAFVTGVAFNYEPMVPATFTEGVPVDFVEAQRVENSKAAKDAVA